MKHAATLLVLAGFGLLSLTLPRPSIASTTPAKASTSTSVTFKVPTAPATPKAGYWGRDRDGWFWYQAPPSELVPEEPEAQAPLRPQPPLDPLQVDLAAHKRWKQELEDSVNAAVINPSPANLSRFLELYAQTRHKASQFTDAARAMVARMPWVDDSSQGVRPAQATAAKVHDQVQLQARNELIGRLGQSHGVFFFFRGDCPYCHAQAPLLKQLERKHGLTVFAISLDGRGIPLFERPVRDNGASRMVMQALSIPEGQFQVPFTVLANPSSREVLPLGFGVMTVQDMEERIELVMRMRSPPSSSLTSQPTAFKP
jgi:conjugal transfer pilus assembly protein TraF